MMLRLVSDLNNLEPEARELVAEDFLPTEEVKRRTEATEEEASGEARNSRGSLTGEMTTTSLDLDSVANFAMTKEDGETTGGGMVATFSMMTEEMEEGTKREDLSGGEMNPSG